jgi:molecular chaperone DnaK
VQRQRVDAVANRSAPVDARDERSSQRQRAPSGTAELVTIAQVARARDRSAGSRRLDRFARRRRAPEHALTDPSPKPPLPRRPLVRWSRPELVSSYEGRVVDAAFAGDDRAPDPLGARLRLVASVRAHVGDELRFELLAEDGSVRAVGLGRVVAHDELGGMQVEIVALGVDPALTAQLVTAAMEAPPSSRAKPPPLPPPSSRRAPPSSPQPTRVQAETPQESAGGEAGVEIEPLPVRRRGVVIGIDLGTTNTCASYVHEGRPRIIPGRTGTSTIPSMITFEPDGSFHIGQRAADRAILYPTRTVYGSKRLLGRTYRPELAAELQGHFAYPLGEAEGQRFGARIDDHVVSMDTIAARVLDEVRSTAEAHLGQAIEAAVITVPAYFTEVQREAVRRAAAQARLVVHRIVNEPTAAAVAYGHKQRQRARVAVFDFGGGTFDFSVVDVQDGALEVIATGGDAFVGGADFDDLLASHLLAEFQRLEGIALEPDAQQIARLRGAAEAAKRELSAQDEALVELPDFTTSPRRALRVEVDRASFDALTRPLVERAIAIAEGVLAAGEIAPTAIDDVLLVGGTTRVPAVQQAVARLFQRRPSKGINPDEAVALGAALLGDELGGTSTLLDILPMSVGRGVERRRFEPLVARHTRLPARREILLDADVMGNVSLPLFQGESPDAAQNEYLCTVIVEDRSLWDRGKAKITLSFDEHCVMAVEASHARSGRGLPVRLDRSRPVDEVLRELGAFEGALAPEWHLPETPLARALGKLGRLFRRR